MTLETSSIAYVTGYLVKKYNGFFNNKTGLLELLKNNNWQKSIINIE